MRLTLHLEKSRGDRSLTQRRVPEKRIPQVEETQRCYEMDVFSLEIFVVESVGRHKNMCMCISSKESNATTVEITDELIYNR